MGRHHCKLSHLHICKAVSVSQTEHHTLLTDFEDSGLKQPSSNVALSDLLQDSMLMSQHNQLEDCGRVCMSKQCSTEQLLVHLCSQQQQVAVMQCHRQEEAQIGHRAKEFTNILQQECSVQECEVSCGIAEDWAQCGAKGSIGRSAEGSQVDGWLGNGCRTCTNMQVTTECQDVQKHINVQHI